MTNQNFRSQAKELFETVFSKQLDFVAQTSLVNILNGYDIKLSDCESKLNEAQTLIEVLQIQQGADDAIQSIAYNSCKQCLDIQTERLNEAIEMIKLLVNATPDFNVNPDRSKDSDLRAAVLMNYMINHPKKMGLEFLNKISSKE